MLKKTDPDPRDRLVGNPEKQQGVFVQYYNSYFNKNALPLQPCVSTSSWTGSCWGPWTCSGGRPWSRLFLSLSQHRSSKLISLHLTLLLCKIGPSFKKMHRGQLAIWEKPCWGAGAFYSRVEEPEPFGAELYSILTKVGADLLGCLRVCLLKKYCLNVFFFTKKSSIYKVGHILH